MRKISGTVGAKHSRAGTKPEIDQSVNILKPITISKIYTKLNQDKNQNFECVAD